MERGYKLYRIVSYSNARIKGHPILDERTPMSRCLRATLCTLCWKILILQ